MTAQPASPNWHWQQLGYTVERGLHKSRTIRRQDELANTYGGRTTY